MNESPYESIHWGTFKKQFERRPPELGHIIDLHHFAKHVLANPEKYNARTEKRARFYLNMVEHHGPPNTYEGGALEVKTLKALIENSYKHDKNNIGQFVLQPMSTHETQVWADYYTHHLVIVFTGTYNTFDWANNAQYLIGNYKNTARFKNAERVFNLAVEKFPNFKVTLVGHSQGGVPEHLLNDKRVYEALFLNPAWTTERQLPNEYIVKSTRDPVSLLVRHNKNNLFIPAKTSNPLHEHSTLILDDLPQSKLIGRGIHPKMMTKKQLIKVIKRHIYKQTA
jgi:hypothetical protein